MRDHLACSAPRSPSAFGPTPRLSATLISLFAILPLSGTYAGEPETLAARGGGNPPASAAAGRLELVQRTLHQDQGDWQVDYTFRNAGAEALTLQPRDLGARTEGWLSNSRIAAHATPRRAASAIDGQLAMTAFAEVISAADESRRCRERVVLSVLPPVSTEAPASHSTPAPAPVARATAPPSPHPTPALTVVEPGATLRVRLRFEHQHMIHGAYDPLLGRRDLELRLGATFFRDSLPLTREQYQAMPRDSWPEPPDDRRDRRYSVSGPDSLHLDAEMPGNNYYSFGNRKVRYSTPMRLRFWYRVAPGSDGQLYARIQQIRSSTESYKPLPDGLQDIQLASSGHWTRFERVFRTEAEATELTLDFRLVPCDIGEAWIDDIVLEPADKPTAGP